MLFAIQVLCLYLTKKKKTLIYACMIVYPSGVHQNNEKFHVVSFFLFFILLQQIKNEEEKIDFCFILYRLFLYFSQVCNEISL